MLPIDPELLLFLKFFIVFTCIFFWVRLAYRWLFRSYHGYRHPHDHQS